jgi:hypothetical protein
MTQREKRLVTVLPFAAAGILIWNYALSDDPKQTTVTPAVAAVDTVPSAEKRLARLRQTSAAVPGRQQVLDKVEAEVQEREKGLIEADTAQQAQAQLIQTVRKLMRAETPPIDMRNSEIGPVKAIDSFYGEVTVSVSFECRIEQLVNLLAAIPNDKQLIATNEIRIGNAHPKEKTMPVRLTLTGVVRRTLIPDKRTGSTL